MCVCASSDHLQKRMQNHTGCKCLTHVLMDFTPCSGNMLMCFRASLSPKHVRRGGGTDENCLKMCNKSQLSEWEPAGTFNVRKVRKKVKISKKLSKKKEKKSKKH